MELDGGLSWRVGSIGVSGAVRVEGAKLLSRIGLIALAAVVAWQAQPLIVGNVAAINLLVTMFTVLAGFLIAIIAVVGDPMRLPPGSWRAAEQDRERIRLRLNDHKWVFVTYLVTLLLIFAALLLEGASDQWPRMGAALEHLFLFFGTYAFGVSFSLPWALTRVQQERVDAEIERRRDAENVE